MNLQKSELKPGLKHLSLSHLHLLDHSLSSHPENSSRLSSILQAFQSSEFHHLLDLSVERRATIDELCSNHDAKYVKEVIEKEGQELNLDRETLLTAGSVRAALMAAGIGLELIERVLDGKIDNGFALLRPPGHHARLSSAMGFCIFNNIAIAAKKALAKGVKRILIFDFDVHHGNGTQRSFYEDDRVLFIDIHQDNLFPVGSGAIQEIGRGKGLGYTINVPLPSGCSDEDYFYIFDNLVAGAARGFHPELILVSAGFDAHESDPLGGMLLSTKGFGVLTAKVKALAEELCKGNVVFFLEGGYNPHFLAQNVMSCVKVLASKSFLPFVNEATEPKMHGLKSLVEEIYATHTQKGNRHLK